MSAEYFCYADGSCKSGEGAPGGWGYFIKPPSGAPIEGHGQAVRTQAKIMEYTAVARALEALPAGARATVFSDNQALIENCAKRLANWRTSGFAHVDPEILPAVREIDGFISSKALRLTWTWVRGHNGNAGNRRADELAALGAREAKAALAQAADSEEVA